MSCKRLGDIFGALCGLALCGPLMLASALAVRLSSPGPALYRARRLGLRGGTFFMYKFRSMRNDPAGPAITAGEADPRITPLGKILRKYRIDELPQLLNVLKGEMSLVGPRPEDPAFLPYYTREEHAALAVRPGLTCPSQLAYRKMEARYIHPGDDPTAAYLAHILHRRLKMDIEYARTHTQWGDFLIILQTMRRLTGASKDN